MSSEGKGTGLQWSTLFSRARPGDPLTMGAVWIMFLVDILIYSVIIAYIDKIAPGKFGVAEKWYFPFTPGFWTSKNKVTNVVVVEKDENEVRDISMFESVPKQEAGIQVNEIKKVFKKVSRIQKQSLFTRILVPRQYCECCQWSFLLRISR